MKMELEKQPRHLPSLEDLYADTALATKFNDLNKLLNQEPKKEWVYQNKFANNSNYMKVARVEQLLTLIYTQWRLEVKSFTVIANSVVVSVRLFVLNPITNEWDWQDGIGACPIQTEKGAGATDFSKVNTSAVQMAAPAAETFAFKDAAEKLGKLFGKDLNRDIVDYEKPLDNKFVPTEVVEVPEAIKFAIEEATLEELSNIFNGNKELHANKEFMQLLTSRKQKLKTNGK